MKKIIILILFIFTLSGCYDYKEINNLGIISAIGIDYKDDEYIVTLEILNDQIDKNSYKITSYTKTGTGKNINKAIEKAADKISNQANYTHVKLLLLSENILNDKFNSIIDFFIRSTYFRENFYVLSTLENSPKEILNQTDKENPIASTNIIDSLENNVYSSNNAVLKSFDLILEEIITFGIDTSFSNIKLNNKEFLVDGLSIFKDTDFKGTIDNENVKLFNILRNEYQRPAFTKDYDDKNVTITLLTGKSNISITSKKINIKGKLSGKIMDNEIDANMRNLEAIKTINNDFTKLLNKKIYNFMKEIQSKESDILGLSKMYYEKNRIKNDNLWKNLDINSNINFKINKNGLIYEVKYEN